MMTGTKHLCWVIILIGITLLSCSGGGGRSLYEEGLQKQQEGNYSSAIELYQQVLDENKSGVWVEQAKERILECRAMLVYFDAHTAFRDGDIDESKELRRQAEELFYSEPDSLYLQGMYDLNDKQYEKAELSFLKLLKDYPAVYLGYLGMAHLDFELSHFGNAIKNVDKAIRYTKREAEKAEGEELLLTLSKTLVNEPEYMDRIAQLLPSTTQNSEVFYLVGYSYNHRLEPQSDQAISFLSRGLSSQNLSKELQANLNAELALAYLLEGVGDKARKYIDRALELFPDNAEYKQLKRRIEQAIADGLKPKQKKPTEKPKEKPTSTIMGPYTKEIPIEKSGE
jgi:tetratricopeptide (TPR) repeat protein